MWMKRFTKTGWNWAGTSALEKNSKKERVRATATSFYRSKNR